MTQVVTAVCPNCGAPQSARFCDQCGEKRVTTHDYSIVHFGEHLLETFTHFDFRSVRTFWTLVSKPGLLTRDFLSGRRKRYVGPIQLFVIANVIFALTGYNSFRTPLVVQENDGPFAAYKRATAAAAIEHGGMSRRDFMKEFDDTAGVQGKTWVFAMIPVFAVFLALLYGFRRYFFQHLVFATHFYAFALLWLWPSTVGTIGGLRAARVTLSPQDVQNVPYYVSLVGFVVYLLVALRRAYGDRWFLAVARSVALALVFLPIVRWYRFLLFFVTLKTMHHG